MAKLFVPIVVLLASILIAGPTTRAAPVSTKNNTRALREGLNVMEQVSKNFASVKVRRNISTGICQLIDYVNKLTHNGSSQNGTTGELFTSESALATAERIRNATCNQLNTLSEGTITSCSSEALDLFCVQMRIHDAALEAAGSTQSIENPDEIQWIMDNIEERPIRDYICSLRQFSGQC